MKDENENSEMEAENNQSEMTKQTRIFDYQPFNINYVNTLHTYESTDEYSGHVKIDNYLCQQEDNKLLKITKVIFNNKVIQIQDVLEFVEKSEEEPYQPSGMEIRKPKTLKTNDKIRIFYQDHLNKIETNPQTEKKDKKNIVKNIVKIFCSWIDRKKAENNSDQYDRAQSQLKSLLNKQNFNNRLIKDIVSNDNVNQMFFKFLVSSAEEQVRYSRIHDKNSHYEAIELYKKLLEKNKQMEFNEIIVSKNQKEQEVVKMEQIDEK